MAIQTEVKTNREKVLQDYLKLLRKNRGSFLYTDYLADAYGIRSPPKTGALLICEPVLLEL